LAVIKEGLSTLPSHGGGEGVHCTREADYRVALRGNQSR
jgi:hypothetical protein